MGTSPGSSIPLACPKSCGLCSGGGGTGTDTLPSQCGRPINAGSRIIGGTYAKKDAWPWQVSLFYNRKFLCGGSVISSKWIVTAAHCVDGFDSRLFHVVLGEYDLRDADSDRQVYQARRAFHHPSWNKYRLNNDIALIELDRPAIFNKHVQPICLPNAGEKAAVGTKCYITGWGQFDIGKTGPPSAVLKQSPLNIVSQTTCSNMNTRNMGIPITQNMVCAGLGPYNSNSGCHGDSGGPFVCQASDGRWVLEGAVSWGSQTCETRQGYTVFARVSNYRSWIARYVN